jgi:hypothetical protein
MHMVFASMLVFYQPNFSFFLSNIDVDSSWILEMNTDEEYSLFILKNKFKACRRVVIMQLAHQYLQKNIERILTFPFTSGTLPLHIYV